MDKPRHSLAKDFFFNVVLLVVGLYGTIFLVMTSQTPVGVATIIIMAMVVPMMTVRVVVTIPFVRQAIIERMQRRGKPRSQPPFRYPMIAWSIGLLAIKEFDVAAYRSGQWYIHLFLMVPALLIGYAVLQGWGAITLGEIYKAEVEIGKDEDRKNE